MRPKVEAFHLKRVWDWSVSFHTPPNNIYIYTFNTISKDKLEVKTTLDSLGANGSREETAMHWIHHGQCKQGTLECQQGTTEGESIKWCQKRTKGPQGLASISYLFDNISLAWQSLHPLFCQDLFQDSIRDPIQDPIQDPIWNPIQDQIQPLKVQVSPSTSWTCL